MARFLKGKIRFLEIYDIIEDCMANYKAIPNPSVEEILDAEASVYEQIERKHPSEK